MLHISSIFCDSSIFLWSWFETTLSKSLYVYRIEWNLIKMLMCPLWKSIFSKFKQMGNICLDDLHEVKETLPRILCARENIYRNMTETLPLFLHTHTWHGNPGEKDKHSQKTMQIDMINKTNMRNPKQGRFWLNHILNNAWHPVSCCAYMKTVIKTSRHVIP